MRQGQQSKRNRGRGRKPANALNRSYDSNGPDVRIRGTAHHIAEKYLALSRDAQASGDRVMAENYLQHAEHYSRIVAAAQAQNTALYQSREEDSTRSETSESPEAAAPQPNGAAEVPGLGEQPVIDVAGLDSGVFPGAANGGAKPEPVPNGHDSSGNGQMHGSPEQKPRRRRPARTRTRKPENGEAAATDQSGSAPLEPPSADPSPATED